MLPVRACYGGGPNCFNEPALAGLTYAVAMGARVINASWPPDNDPESRSIGSFIHNQPNVLFVFAIGGSDQNDDPYTLCTDKATFPNVLCVGLANPDDSAGTVNADATTDVSAPGNAGVPTTTGARGGFGYTSGATAHVSGAAALLRGLAPNLSAPAIAQVLVSTSRQVAGYQTANKAHGIIDVEAAVRAVQQVEGLVTPAPGHGAPADSPDPFAGQRSHLRRAPRRPRSDGQEIEDRPRLRRQTAADDQRRLDAEDPPARDRRHGHRQGQADPQKIDARPGEKTPRERQGDAEAAPRPRRQARAGEALGPDRRRQAAGADDHGHQAPLTGPPPAPRATPRRAPRMQRAGV